MKKIGLRPPEEVMRLSTLGAFFPTRLSFMRALLRRIKKENWHFNRRHWDIDAQGRGTAIYCARLPNGFVYSLVVFGHAIPPEKRTDRVIADMWDATFTLYDGAPTARAIDSMRQQVPRQELGRNSRRQLVLSRANRSVRVFDAVINKLAQGIQPINEIAQTGYLMRTTAVYGNGKFNIADYSHIANRPEFATPFAAEMLAIFMFRAFTADLAEYMAKIKSQKRAVNINPQLRRQLGIGNSTGLGMAPFLVNHPILLHKWIHARESALCKARRLNTSADNESFCQLVDNAKIHVEHWQTNNTRQRRRIARLKKDLRLTQKHILRMDFSINRPWNALYEWAARYLSDEGREMIVSLILELRGNIVDALSNTMSANENFIIDGSMSIGKFRQLLKRHYAWIWRADFSQAKENARFWYVSEEKQEPRLGERAIDAGADLELPLAVMRDAQKLSQALKPYAAATPLSSFLLSAPEHRHIARRVQITAQYPYSEIRDNLIAATMLPIDMLRCKLSFFGAACFDPRSDRWLRINMFANAPYPFEINSQCDVESWMWLPSVH